ncbi:MAG: proton-conducting transporter membrane subunit, partial [Cyanobacteriota bacterium]|nr:proton-conducting transporter membrane subunit [Cyanobacteriota bacterium]
GITFIAVGTGQPETALLLLLTYAPAMALLVMSTGGIILNNITQDLTQYGGLWSRRPISGLCFIVGVLALIAMPPLGGFWTLQNLIESLWNTQPVIAGVLLIVNALTAFSLTREFGLIFAGKPKQMTVRSPEGLWALVLPMTILAGFCLHLSLLLGTWNLLPELASLDKVISGLLLLSSVVGCGLGCLIYVNDNWPKPVQLGSPAIQNFFAYDFYTAKLYRLTIIAAVATVSKIMSWVDRYLVDGVVNLVGFVTIFSGQSLRYNVSGQTQFYALTIVLGITLILGYLAYSLF